MEAAQQTIEPGLYIVPYCTWYPHNETGCMWSPEPGCMRVRATNGILQFEMALFPVEQDELRKRDFERIHQEWKQKLEQLDVNGVWALERFHPDWPDHRSIYFARGKEHLSCHQIRLFVPDAIALA